MNFIDIFSNRYINISVELGDEITDVDLVVSTSWYDMRLKDIEPRFGKGFKIRP